MKPKYSLVFVVFITTTLLLSGCGKSNSGRATENANLKARIQQLEQQLQAARSQTAPTPTPAPPKPASAPEPAAVQHLKSRLAEAQKQAETAADKLKFLTDQVQSQKGKIVALTRQLSTVQQAGDKAKKTLKFYQDATSAIDQFQTLRIALGGQTVEVADYHQKYLAVKRTVTKLAKTLPQPEVRQQIMAVLGIFTQVNDICETADRQMQARTRQARANYDKFLKFGGLGPNRYVIQIGKDKILAPAEQANAVTSRQRDQQIVALETDLDLGIKDLQTLVNRQST